MRTSKIIWAATVALSAPLLAVEANAQTLGEVRAYVENDSINPFGEGTDQHYTNGLKVEWLSSERSRDNDFLPGISHSDWCRLLCGDDAEGRGVNAGFAIGQNMYTPANIGNPRPQPNDRPWAGMLYGSRIARVRYDEPSLAAQREDRFEIMLGIVGPASLAKETQIRWHQIVDAPRPRGWDNQLRNEPVLQLRYETALRWPPKEGGNADIIPRVRANLGNSLVSLEAEVTGRIGWNLSGFGVGPAAQLEPEPAAEFNDKGNGLAGSRWLASGNVFLRAGIKAVAHNIFIDGNTFVDNDIRIHRLPFVPEIAAGIEINLVGPIWVTYQFIHRGSEFETRSGRNGPPQEFSAISVAWTTGL